jgi:hypothetical protein
MKKTICTVGKRNWFRETYGKIFRINSEETKQESTTKVFVNIKCGFQLRTNMCQDKLGNLVTGDTEVLNR